ncbi:MAG: hypothetical protein OEW45_10830 [Deltaproteobacteria bacterium]|nr:hypothetical protein [Deltaproteobacteria bacterium]
MVTIKSKWILFGILVISAWVLGSAVQAGAETLKFKVYSYETKAESVPVDDVEGHTLNIRTRRAFCILENGEVATQSAVMLGDFIKQSGSSIAYTTITFSDGSSIISKAQGSIGPSAQRGTREIIKGTGRFEGIKGTGTGASKFLPVEKGEAGPKAIGELILTYTLPPK